MVINRDSHVSFVGYTSMATVYEQAVEETWKGATARLSRKDLPPRLGYKDDFYIPLYAGFGIAPRPVVARPAGNGSKPAAAPAAAPAPAPKASPETLAAWDTRLRDRVSAALKAGRAPTFRFAMVPDRDSVLSACDGSGALKVRSGASEMSVPWTVLSPEDKRGLALALAESGGGEDLALAAFYHLVTGRAAEGERFLERAGAAGEAVRSSLGIPKP
jgi:hypothetical protein